MFNSFLKGKAKPSKSNVYMESMEMISSSLIIYILADLRDMAREGELGDVTLSQLEPPQTLGAVMERINSSKDVLQKQGGYENLQEQLLALEKICQRKGGGVLASFLGEKTSRLLQFVDTAEKNEMVHAVALDDFRKRVVIIFRGSVTDTDFIMDAKIYHKEINNPVHKLDAKTPEKVKVHSGFHGEYCLSQKTDIPFQDLAAPN